MPRGSETKTKTREDMLQNSAITNWQTYSGDNYYMNKQKDPKDTFEIKSNTHNKNNNKFYGSQSTNIKKDDYRHQCQVASYIQQCIRDQVVEQKIELKKTPTNSDMQSNKVNKQLEKIFNEACGNHTEIESSVTMFEEAFDTEIKQEQMSVIENKICDDIKQVHNVE